MSNYEKVIKTIENFEHKLPTSLIETLTSEEITSLIKLNKSKSEELQRLVSITQEYNSILIDAYKNTSAMTKLPLSVQSDFEVVSSRPGSLLVRPLKSTSATTNPNEAIALLTQFPYEVHGADVSLNMIPIDDADEHMVLNILIHDNVDRSLGDIFVSIPGPLRCFYIQIDTLGPAGHF